MWPRRYYPARFYAPRFFPQSRGEAVSTSDRTLTGTWKYPARAGTWKVPARTGTWKEP